MYPLTDPIAVDRSGREPLSAAVKRRRGISIVWAVPIVAPLIGGYLADASILGHPQ